MKHPKPIGISILFILAFNFANAQTNEPGNENNKLKDLAGRWTIQGMEERFVEICDMYPGGYFLVCNSEIKTKAGGLNKGVSILGSSPTTNILTYYHYGSTGESQTLKGKINDDGSLYFEGEEIIQNKLTKTRVLMKKAGDNYNFKEETSIDGSPWATSAEFVYVRIKQ